MITSPDQPPDLLEPTWRKTGLWVPKPLTPFGNRFGQRGLPGRPCCCETPCEGTGCNCSLSSNTNVKCCMNVTIAGMAGGGGPTCSEAECLEYNTTYSLYRSEPDDDGNCVWKCGFLDQDCAADEIIATLYLDGSDYKLKVELGGHVWEKDYGETKPDLCTLANESLTWQSDTSGCNSSSATCVVTMVDGDVPCDCGPPCENCIDGVGPPEFLLTFSGITRNGGLCPNCDNYNDSFVVFYDEAVSTPTNCAYLWTGAGLFCDAGGSAPTDTFGLSLFTIGGVDKIQVGTSGTNGFVLWAREVTFPLDCNSINELELPVSFEAFPGHICDFSTSIVKVTALP